MVGPIRVNSHVYETVRNAQDDWGSDNISDSEMNDIEQAIAADGNVDAGEEALLNKLRSGSSFTITDGTNSTPIDPSTVSFPTSSSVATWRAGRVMVEEDEGVQTNLPSYIPRQTAGAGTDVINSDTYSSRSAAQSAFNTARSRMLDVNNWNTNVRAETNVNPVMPSFSLAKDTDGNGLAGVGDVIKIDPPGGSPMYVRVENVVDTPGEFAIQVRPCDSSGNTSGATDHMYTNAATNTFRLTLNGNTVTNGFHGRNEVVNSNTGSTMQNLENRGADAAMAAGGRSFNWDTMGDAWRVDP